MALFCHVPESHIIDLHDVTNIWHVPLIMHEQGCLKAIFKCLQMEVREPDLVAWGARAHRWDALSSKATVAMVGKYTGLSDAYLSVIKSLEHACIACGHRLDLKWVDAEHLEPGTQKSHPEKFDEAWAVVKAAECVLVPGGFGDRGVEGKIAAAHYAREARAAPPSLSLSLCRAWSINPRLARGPLRSAAPASELTFVFPLLPRTHRCPPQSKKPYLGICLGLQVAVIDAARTLLGYADANSTEFQPATPHPAVVFMPEGSRTHKGGTMRLGVRRTVLQTVDCIAAKLYQRETHIDERHRHRYEARTRAPSCQSEQPPVVPHSRPPP